MDAMADAMQADATQTNDFPCLPSGLAEINKMIEEHGNLFSDSQCKVCSAVLISDSQKLAHYQSKKHANKVRRYLSLQSEEPELKKLKPLSPNAGCNNGDTDRSKVCHVCNMTFYSPVTAECHYQGKVHAKNLRLKTVGPQTPASQTAPVAKAKKTPADDSSSAPVSVGIEDKNNPDRFCSTCQASFNNPLMAHQHYEGKKHRKRMTKLKLLETYGPSTTPASTLNGYPCTVCNIELNSVEQYQSHITGSKHKNQVKKLSLRAENQPGQHFYNPLKFIDPDVDDMSSPKVDLYPPGEEPYPPEDELFDPEKSQYAPENTEYTEEPYT
ncbi:zinc finger protein 346 isoform 2-T2 [Pholidichthys leucotaenia]